VIRKLRVRFWLLMMSVAFSTTGYGSRWYLFCVRRASDATDWGPPLTSDGSDGNDGEAPF